MVQGFLTFLSPHSGFLKPMTEETYFNWMLLLRTIPPNGKYKDKGPSDQLLLFILGALVSFLKALDINRSGPGCSKHH